MRGFKLALLIAVAFGVTACGSTNQENPTQSEPAPLVLESTTPTPEVVNEEVKVYVTSPERNAAFMETVPLAGIRIAQELQAGTFGPVFRYDDWKETLPADYVGWGGISANDDSAFAWVWWDHEEIDFSKPIFHVYLADTQHKNRVAAVRSTDLTDHWEAVRYVGDDGLAVGAVNDDYTFPTTSESVEYPNTRDELSEFDDEVLAQLNENMVDWFGVDWR